MLIILAQFQTKTSLNGVEPNQWLPTWWKGDGGGLAMSPTKKLHHHDCPAVWRPCDGGRWGRNEQMEKTWSSIQVMAKDRQMWKDYLAAPRQKATRRNGHEWVMTTCNENCRTSERAKRVSFLDITKARFDITKKFIVRKTAAVLL